MLGMYRIHDSVISNGFTCFEPSLSVWSSEDQMMFVLEKAWTVSYPFGN